MENSQSQLVHAFEYYEVHILCVCLFFSLFFRVLFLLFKKKQLSGQGRISNSAF